jgi:hypothetical protein
MGRDSGSERVTVETQTITNPRRCNDPNLLTYHPQDFFRDIPGRDPGGETIVLVLSEVDGEHARLEVHGEPVGHVQHLLPLLHRRLKVLLLAQVLYLARLHRNRKLKTTVRIS